MNSGYILVIRLSAMGDVALTVPVVKGASEHRQILVLTRKPFDTFYQNTEGVEVFIADTGYRHRGLAGILRLYRDIRAKVKIDRVVDLHAVIRSFILSTLFRLGGTPVERINKGRKEKARFIKNGADGQLPHTTERYRKVFLRSGIDPGDLKIPAFSFSSHEKEEALGCIESLGWIKGKKLVGLAPFARHQTKQWPQQYMSELIDLIDRHYNTLYFLFGAPSEAERLQFIKDGRDNVHVIAGSLGIRTELALLSFMDIVVSMDSSNMHLAALAGTATASIWGGTHPGTGFSAVGEQRHIIIETDKNKLTCRPCTVYGKGECINKVHKYQCLEDITPTMVADKIIESGILL